MLSGEVCSVQTSTTGWPDVSRGHVLCRDFKLSSEVMRRELAAVFPGVGDERYLDFVDLSTHKVKRPFDQIKIVMFTRDCNQGLI